ncbi:MAG: AhpC/TSA family protein [Bacteroidales bacterium]|nr:AhpC/TSA family protein [Bacteroidales bacterium]
MKTKFFALLALLAALSSCITGGERFRVNGTLTDSIATTPGSMVYLLGAGGWSDIVDSAKVSDGKFSFSGMADKTTSLVAVLKFPGRTPRDDRFLARFVPDSKDISIDLDYPATVTGSPLTDAMNDLQENIMDLYFERESEIGELAMSGRREEADSLYKAQMAKIDDLCRSSFLEHSGDVVGLQAFSLLAQDLGYDELEGLLAQASSFIAEDPNVKDILHSKKLERDSGPGAAFSDIAGVKADRTPIRLSEFVGKGKWVLTDFWASWCGPCMNAIPNLREIRERYAPAGLVLVGINVWDRSLEAGFKCAEEKDMVWDIIFTEDYASSDPYGIQAIPSFILFAPDGTIADRIVGEEGLESMLAKNLGAR